MQGASEQLAELKAELTKFDQSVQSRRRRQSELFQAECLQLKANLGVQPTPSFQQRLADLQTMPMVPEIPERPKSPPPVFVPQIPYTPTTADPIMDPIMDHFADDIQKYIECTLRELRYGSKQHMAHSLSELNKEYKYALHKESLEWSLICQMISMRIDMAAKGNTTKKFELTEIKLE
jgi:hypothetical protein